MRNNFTKLFALVAMFTYSLTAWSATTDDLKTISTDYVFIADDFTENGTVGWTRNALYDGNLILACGSGGNTAAANQGTSTFEGGKHLNSLRLKNNQDMLAIKVAGACTIHFYTKSHGSRGVTAGTTPRTSQKVGDVTTYSGCDEYKQQTAGTTEWECDVKSAGIVYIASYEGDFYIAGFVVTFDKTGQPTINTQPISTSYYQNVDADALTVSATAASEGALSYQWYKNTTNRSALVAEGAEAIDGATSASYTPSTAEVGTTYYFCKVTEADNANVAVSKICSVTVNEPGYMVTFSIGESGASGVVPAEAARYVSLTIPVNRTLYKEGYTLTGWNDGTATYAIGATYTPEADATLTPVFTANTYTLNQTTTEMTVTWNFRRDQGAPTVAWEGTPGHLLVTQAVINSVSTDVKIDIDATSGKFNNANSTDWCQVNDGTTLTFPTCENAIVRTYTYKAPTNDNPVGTLDGATHTSVDGNVATYTVTATSGSSVFVANANGQYFRYIEVVFPANGGGSALDNTNADAKAVKVIRNGQLVIIRDGVEYNALGNRL